MIEEKPSTLTPKKFAQCLLSVDPSAFVVNVTSLANGNKKVVLSQPLCEENGEPNRLEFGFVAQGKLAGLDDSELVNVVTEAVAAGLLNGALDLDKVNGH